MQNYRNIIIGNKFFIHIFNVTPFSSMFIFVFRAVYMIEYEHTLYVYVST